MVVLRATKRVLRYLPPPTVAPAPSSDTVLGDWYVNRLVIDRHPLLLIVSARSLLAILAPARDVRGLPARLPSLVTARLRRLGVAPSLIDAEVGAMEPVVLAPTLDRSVLGSMTDFVKAVPHYLPIGGWDATTLHFAEDRLAETPCRLGAAIFPEQEGPRLLAAAGPQPAGSAHLSSFRNH